MSDDTPVISFSFDDFPSSALLAGGAILEDFGLRATYYTALGLMGTDAPVGRIFSLRELEMVVERGHELGCHTFDHCNAWSTPPDRFEASILRNRDMLAELLPGAHFPTHSYPLDIPQPNIKRRVEKYFACCRGGSQTINRGRLDLNYLRSFFLERCRGSRALAHQAIDENRRSGGWLILSTHDIAATPTKFGCTIEFFRNVVQYSVDSGSTILPVASALRLKARTKTR